MFGMVRIGAKLLSIQEAADRLKNTGLFVGEFSESMRILSLEFPFVVAIPIVNACEGSIRGSSQEITEAEAV